MSGSQLIGLCVNRFVCVSIPKRPKIMKKTHNYIAFRCHHLQYISVIFNIFVRVFFLTVPLTLIFLSLQLLIQIPSVQVVFRSPVLLLCEDAHLCFSYIKFEYCAAYHCKEVFIKCRQKAVIGLLSHTDRVVIWLLANTAHW